MRQPSEADRANRLTGRRNPKHQRQASIIWPQLRRKSVIPPEAQSSRRAAIRDAPLARSPNACTNQHDDSNGEREETSSSRSDEHRRQDRGDCGGTCSAQREANAELSKRGACDRPPHRARIGAECDPYTDLTRPARHGIRGHTIQTTRGHRSIYGHAQLSWDEKLKAEAPRQLEIYVFNDSVIRDRTALTKS